MRNIAFLGILLTIALLAQPGKEAFAQKAKEKSAVDRTPPKALFVRLNTYQRRREYFTRTNNQKMLRQLDEDTRNMMRKITMDFSDNFSFCPVYYFMDSNEHLIKTQQFTYVLLDKNLKPVTILTFEPYENYFIATFGVPHIPQADQGSDNKDPYDTNFVNTRGKNRLLVLDKYLQPLQKPLPGGSNKGLSRGSMKKPASEYKYTSPKFDISYKPVAGKYSEQLESFYGSRGKN